MQVVEVLHSRIADLNTNIRTLLTVYMQWFTFYWTMNSVALAWFWSKPTTGTAATSPPAAVLWFFALMAVPSACSSFIVMRSVLAMRAETERVSTQLASLVVAVGDDSQRPLITTATWPYFVTRWGLSVNGATTFVLGLLWLYLAIR